MMDRIADSRGWSIDEVESSYTVDQIVLFYYWSLRREIRSDERSAKLTAAYLASFITGG